MRGEAKASGGRRLIGWGEGPGVHAELCGVHADPEDAINAGCAGAAELHQAFHHLERCTGSMIAVDIADEHATCTCFAFRSGDTLGEPGDDIAEVLAALEVCGWREKGLGVDATVRRAVDDAFVP